MKTILSVALLLILTMTGCGKSARIAGKVTFADGSPLDAGRIVFENDKLSFSGKIHKDGSFQLGVSRDGEPIPRGKYQVGIVNAVYFIPDSDGAVIHLVSEPLRNSLTSGIEYDIQKNMTDMVVIVEPPDAKAKKEEEKQLKTLEKLKKQLEAQSKGKKK